jgi:hypothetical protein
MCGTTVSQVNPTFQYDDGGRAAAGYKGDTGDCVVRAIAIAAELPYQHVYDRVAEINKHHGKRKEKTARKGVEKRLIRQILSSNGWVWTPTMHIGSGCKVHLRANELPTGRLIVSVSKHVVAVMDGVIHDTYDCSREGTRCVYGYYRKAEAAR